MVMALLILMGRGGVTKWTVKKLKIVLAKITKDTSNISMAANSIGVLMLGIVINSHFTKTRRVKINVTIRYDQNLN